MRRVRDKLTVKKQDDIVAKPFQIPELMQKMDQLMSRTMESE